MLSRLSWRGSTEPSEFMVTIEEIGRLSLKNWRMASPPVLEKRDSLLRERDWHALAALEDRYRRLRLGDDERLVFPKAVVLALGEHPGTRPFLFIQLFPDHLEIWSTAFRNRNLQESDFEL